jgi:hypothetical protein
MWTCPDPRVTYLRDLGYNVISLPRAGIRPLTIAFLQKDRLVELGYLPEIWTSEAETPKSPPGDDEVAKMKGKSTSQLAAKVGLDVLSQLVQAIGVDPIKVNAEYRSAHTLEFHFQEVNRERVTAAALGAYLQKGKLATDNPFVRHYVGTDEKFYIVTEVLTSKSFAVTARDTAQAGVNVKVPVIEQAASGSAGVKVKQEAEGTVSFDGPSQLPFAFIAAQLTRKAGRWDVVEFPQPGSIHFGLSDKTASAPDGVSRTKGGAFLFEDDAGDLLLRSEEGHPEKTHCGE